MWANPQRSQPPRELPRSNLWPGQPGHPLCSRNAPGFVCLVGWSFWSVWFFWMNFRSDQPDKPDRRDRPDEPVFVGPRAVGVQSAPPLPIFQNYCGTARTHDVVKLNKSFRWVGIPCSWDCFRCWPRCWRSKVKTAAKGQQKLLERTIDPTVIWSYFIGSYL